MPTNKNLRTIKITVNAQTLYHLRMAAAMAGYGEKDLGRVVDKLIKTYRQSMRGGESIVRAFNQKDSCAAD